MLPYIFEKIMMSELRLVGYNDAQVVPGRHIQPIPNLPVTITDTRLSIPKDFQSTPDISRKLKELQAIHKLANEATWLFDNTPDSRAKGMLGQKQFAKYMNTMLNASLSDSGEPQYFVQTREYDGSLTTNCRTNSFMDAKVHFLVLSSILHNLPAFELQHMEQMHRALIYRGLHDTDMQPKESALVQRAIEAMEQTFPGLAADRPQPEPETSQEVEP
jgi:hypothetical protein